jgi:riboflavin transporter FmnP
MMKGDDSMKKTLRSKSVLHLVGAAMFLAAGLILPFFTGQIPQIGSMLLPMHLPVLLCGLLCGWQYGGAVGAVLPLLRYVLFGMPPIFPTGVAMTFELACYGLLAGFLYAHSRWKCIASLYRSLLAAMVAGRLVWGGVQLLLAGVTGEPFTLQLFMAGAFFGAIPGIVLQLVFIPLLMAALHRTGMIVFSKRRKPDTAYKA